MDSDEEPIKEWEWEIIKADQIVFMILTKGT